MPSRCTRSTKPSTRALSSTFGCLPSTQTTGGCRQRQRGAQVGNVLVGDVFQAFIEGDIVDTPVAQLFEQGETSLPLNSTTTRSGISWPAGAWFPPARTGHDMDSLAAELRQSWSRAGGASC